MAKKLKAHPRLYITQQQLATLSQRPEHPELVKSQRDLKKMAEQYVTMRTVPYRRNTHNEHLLRARAMQRCVVTLLVRYFQTNEKRFRDAVVRHVRSMDRWQYWSWIAWRMGNDDPLAMFDLSYGENSATLAIAYDLLHHTLSEKEKAMFIDIAWRRSIASFLKSTAPSKPKPSWFGRKDSNWNTVCTGGAGMLALAMYEDIPEAREVVKLTEQSFGPYMKSLAATDGAWPEGIGYWNYGMRYAFMFLLSHENAMGRPHKLLRQDATVKTLRFPLDFSPGGVPCSFGDVNHWRPLPIHFEMAQRLNMPALLGELDDRLMLPPHRDETWPQEAELLLMHPREIPARPAPQKQVAKLYKGQDWALLADQWPAPRLAATVRGGTTEVPHAHRDLTSFHCVVRDEAMISNLGPSEYLDSTFSGRRWELFEMIPASKNVLLINGVGIAAPTSVATRMVSHGKWQGVHLDASNSMGRMRDNSVAKSYQRLLLMLGDKALLVLDRLITPHVARAEVRMHSYATPQLRGKDQVLLTGQREKMRVLYSCNEDAELLLATDPTTSPGPVSQMLRWRSCMLHSKFIIGALLVPGYAKGTPKLAIREDASKIRVTATAGGKRFNIALSSKLLPAK